uniref:Integrin_alpha2 domain-containing protein n=1 Tax=Syphacia muris TaxID=451379 RepID=A0A0N5AE12_9BILA
MTLLMCLCFNLDVHSPIFKIGPKDSYFGFSVAGHFNGANKPLILSCLSGDMPKNDRQNDYGLCMEGFSAYFSFILLGLPGARRWTGGVAAKTYPGDLYESRQEKRTMRVKDGIFPTLQAHDYLGYSVTRGRYGFWYESAKNSTIAAGATRLYGNGAVIFLPLVLEFRSAVGLKLTEDSFILNGTRLGSGFGYSVATIDLNNDKFDDLIVGAPFEYTGKADEGGAVYVYFSSGFKRGYGQSNLVFLKPIRIAGKGVYSQFGTSLAPLGNVDGDPRNLNDFAVGAPFADGGGGVFLYSGAKSQEEFSTIPEQVREIFAKDFEHIYPGTGKLKTFGFSLSGLSDLDENGYNDLVVGAVASDTVVLLRARPVINVKTWHSGKGLKVDIKRKSCPLSAVTCFNLTTFVLVDNTSTNTELLNFSEDVFICTLQVCLFLNIHYLDFDFAIFSASKLSFRLYHLTRKANTDFINALKFLFSVKIRDASTPRFPRNGGAIVNLSHYPALNKFGSEHEFTVQFEKKCGDDDVCNCDLVLQLALTGIAFVFSKEDDGTYVTQVNGTAMINITFSVENKGERAYESYLYVEYSSSELEVPSVRNKKGGLVRLDGTKENMAIISLGNPLEPNKKLVFELTFMLTNGRTSGIGKPLEFRALVNSTSHEDNTDDNARIAIVRVIKRAEIELTAESSPYSVRFGGPSKGAYAMKYDEDIGPEVYHRYYVTNHGPWVVSNVTLEIDWPYQLTSKYSQGKHALYLIDFPKITTSNVDENNGNSKRCSVLLPEYYVNPLQVIITNTYSVEDEIENQTFLKEQNYEKAGSQTFLPASFFRQFRSGGKHDERVATVNCAEKTAKCFKIKCDIDFLSEHATATIEVRARLWNSTFVEDYYDVTYVIVSSHGEIVLDPLQGIEERDKNNNFAFARTDAYPDKPTIPEQAIPLWLYIAAALGGILILLLLVIILWKCGFFKRHRPNQPLLHQAELEMRMEDFTES